MVPSPLPFFLAMLLASLLQVKCFPSRVVLSPMINFIISDRPKGRPRYTAGRGRPGTPRPEDQGDKERAGDESRRACREGQNPLITISRIERGERDPHVRTLAQITRGLGVPAYELLRSVRYFEGEDDE